MPRITPISGFDLPCATQPRFLFHVDSSHAQKATPPEFLAVQKKARSKELTPSFPSSGRGLG